MRTLSSNFLSGAQEVQTSKVYLKLLHVVVYENNDSVTNLYYVDNKEDIVSNSITYNRASFDVTMGDDTEESVPQVTLRFDSGDRDFIRKLREVNKAPDFNLSFIVSNSPNTVEIGPISLRGETVQIVDTLVSMNLIVEPIWNETVPSDIYTPSLTPGLWGNVSVS
jgi:hypothetical protein